MSLEKPAFSERTLDAAELLQFLGSKVASPVTGSSSSAYRQLIFHKQPHLKRTALNLLEIPGDPSADTWLRQRWPRLWPSIAVIGASREEIFELYNEHRREDFRQALAYTATNRPDSPARVGYLRNEKEPLFGWLRGNHDDAVVGMRLGSGNLFATMGLWLVEERRLVTPESLHVVVPQMPLRIVDKVHPHLKVG